MSGTRAEVEELMRRAAEQAEDARAARVARQRELDAILRSVMDLADSVERVRETVHAQDALAIHALAMQVQELLTDHGLIAFRPAVGDAVDGNADEVMAAVPRPGLRSGTVTAVIRPGYRSGERIVRRAGVEIVKEQA